MGVNFSATKPGFLVRGGKTYLRGSMHFHYIMTHYLYVPGTLIRISLILADYEICEVENNADLIRKKQKQ